MIEVEDVTKLFGTTRALDHVSLSVGAGRMLALLGPNGAAEPVRRPVPGSGGGAHRAGGRRSGPGQPGPADGAAPDGLALISAYAELIRINITSSAASFAAVAESRTLGTFGLPTLVLGPCRARHLRAGVRA
jgi:hypothetical protein